eukprot:COSAG02_NODE_179_length_31090_cov_49.813785_19_plen_152_part_00
MDPDAGARSAGETAGVEVSQGERATVGAPTIIDHFEYKVSRFPECKQMYSQALGTIGIELKWADDAAAGFGLREDKDRVMLLLEATDEAATFHLAFGVSDVAQVDAFHTAALAAGGTCNGPPGPRPAYGPKYYAAFVTDPAGNNIEAVCRN